MDVQIEFSFRRGHYWLYSSRFPQTRNHKIFLFVWLCTLGFFGIGWIIDAFRILNWIGNYTVTVHGEQPRNTWQVDVRDGKIAHKIRDALYLAMAPTRQLDHDTKNLTVSRLSQRSNEHCRLAMHEGKGITGTGYMVVTHDQVLLNRCYGGGLPCGGGIKNEWVSVFLKDIEGIEITKPAQWTTVSFCLLNFSILC